RRRGQRHERAFRQGLRRVQEGAGGHAPAHVSRDHGAAVRRDRQDHPGRGHGSGRRGAISPAQRAGAAAYGAANAAGNGRRPISPNLVGGIVAVLLVVALIVAYSSLFTVYQTRQALVVRLGDPKRVVTEPGLNYKLPLLDSVIYIDNRILDLENPAQEVIAS